MTVILRNTPQTQPPFTKRRPLRVIARPAAQASRIRDSRGIFELTKALKSADKALVVWTLRGWVAHNQAKKKGYRDGYYWTFNSLERWQEKHFPWLTVKQLGALMTQLVKQGVVIRTRRSVHTCYWYRVNERALSSLCAALSPANSLRSQAAGLKDKTSEQPAQTSEHKTGIQKEENLKQKNIQRQNTTTHDATVVVVGLPHGEPEAESGEYSADGEGHDTAAVKAFVPHEQQHDNQPISKVPQKVLSAGEGLKADLIRLGVTLARTQQIVQQYPETDIRYVIECARAITSLTNPPGFLVRELERGTAGVLGLRDIRKDLRPQRDPSIVAWEEQIKRDMERMIAEDASAIGVS